MAQFCLSPPIEQLKLESCPSYPDSLYNFDINSMTPAPESAVLLVPAFLLAGFALWTSVTINAFGIIAFGLIVAWRHSGNLLKNLLVVATQLIVVVVVASRAIAG